MRELNQTKHHQILHDLVINEHICNMACSYCMVPYSPLNRFSRQSQTLGIQQINNNSVGLDYENNYVFREALDKTLDNYLQYFDAPILKISGGEILMVKNLEKLLARESKRYEGLQLLTNGLLFTRDHVTKLKKISNLHVQFSLDGHNLEMNCYRAKTPARQRKLLANLDLIVRSGIPVEIYCVLHDRNTHKLKDFLDYLQLHYKDRVSFTCFPVRHKPAETYRASGSQLNGLKQVINEFDCYRTILPPLYYLRKMYDFMADGKQVEGRCYIPFLMLQSFEDGTVTPCVYSWVEEMGNLADNPEKVASDFGKTASYRIRSRNPRRPPFCKQCFIDAFVYCFYIDKFIGIESLTWNRPLLRLPAIKDRLKEFRTNFSRNQLKE